MTIDWPCPVYRLQGPPGCLAGETLLWDPVAGAERPIAELASEGRSIWVQTLNGPRRATAPFLKGWAPLYRVTMTDGASVIVTGHHRFLTRAGWTVCADLAPGMELLLGSRQPALGRTECVKENALFAPTLDCCASAHGKRPGSLGALLLEEASAFVHYKARWGRVQSVVWERDDVYFDLFVPGEEHYLAHGIFHHNTGKTWTLTNKWIPRAVEKHTESAIYVCSLTRAAAAEIGGRANLPRQNVSTLHALAFRALGKPPLANDRKNVESWNNSVRVDWRVTGTAKQGSDDLEFSGSKADNGDKLLDEATSLRNKMTAVDLWPSDVRKFYVAWRDWKRDVQFLDFTDLIEMPVELDTPPPDGLKVLICDEAQDFTYLDIALLRHWAKWCEMIVMAGDRNQALFTWIGANPKAFIPDSLPDSEITNLGQSYRVPESVRAYATRWLEQDSDHRHFPYAARKDENGKTVTGTVRQLPALNLEEPTRLVKDIVARLDEDNEVMVLASCRFLLARLIKRLRFEGVPFYNPYRLKEGSWNPMRGGPDRLACFLRPFRLEIEGHGAWTWKELLRWSEPVRAKGTFRHGAMGEIKFLSKKVDGPVTREQLQSIFEPDALDELEWAMESEDVGRALDWYESRLLKTGRDIMEMAIAVARSRGIKALVDRPRLIIGTCHSVKGGWADVVYLSPDLGASAIREWNNLGSPDGRNAIVRTFYVGMTRAKKAVALLGSGTKNRVKWI